MPPEQTTAVAWEELLATLETRLALWESSIVDGAYPDDLEWPTLDGDIPPHLEGRARQLLSRYRKAEEELLARRRVLRAALTATPSSGRPSDTPLFVDRRC